MSVDYKYFSNIDEIVLWRCGLENYTKNCPIIYVIINILYFYK